MKLLCAGFGQLNQRVAQRWLQDDRSNDVVAIRRSKQDPNLGVEQLNLDLAEHIWPDVGADVVAVALSARERTPEGYKKAYVDPIQRLASSLTAWKKLPERILVVGSTRVFQVDDGSEVNDSCVPATNDPYGIQLLGMDKAVRQLPVLSAVVRLSGIYGPGRNWLKRQALAAEDNPPTRNHWTNRIHIDDAAAAIVHLLQQPTLLESYLVSDLAPQPLLDMFNYLRKLAGQEPLADQRPPSGGKRIVPSRLIASGFQWHYPDAFAGGYL